ncbi:N-acetylglucosaminidase [Mammaliicoccus stepanovicii]|uniref:N-acetylglucosaminidase n=1 Tax=Mammaliicoccus stepanovicii TaxID=643214 RepID=UPI0035315774
MIKFLKDRFAFILGLTIIIVFVILLIIFESPFFKNYQTHTYEEALQIQTKSDSPAVTQKDNKFVYAKKEDIDKYMDIEKSQTDLQFMDISKKVNISEKDVKEILKDKGVLKGKEKAFLDAQEKHGVNVIYLMSHAFIETGNGNSELASGVKMSNGKTFYNFYGIGAFDQDAVETGSSFARKQDWTSPEKAIHGGAKFVKKDYLNNDQNTLYKMRWNPYNPGQHLYATDVNWATSIGKIMEHYYDKYDLKKADINKNYYK